MTLNEEIDKVSKVLNILILISFVALVILVAISYLFPEKDTFTYQEIKQLQNSKINVEVFLKK